MSRILDPKFRYVPASKTNIRNTFRRERERLKEQAEAEKQSRAAKVQPIKRAVNKSG